MSASRLSHIKSLNIPTLIITGSIHDAVLKQPESSLYLSKHLGGRIVVFPNGGHAIRLQYPERHNAILRDFLYSSIEIHAQRFRDAQLASSISASVSHLDESSSSSSSSSLQKPSPPRSSSRLILFEQKSFWWGGGYWWDRLEDEKTGAIRVERQVVSVIPFEESVVSRWGRESLLLWNSDESDERVQKCGTNNGSTSIVGRGVEKGVDDEGNVGDNRMGPEQVQQPARRAFGVFQTLATMRFGFSDFVSMIPGI
jgi:hypothetical protein